jgi:tetratricopeptide (TPR) repeat protein
VAAQDTPAERLIEAGHWKRARAIVEPHFLQAPDDPLANFLMSQIRAAFGDRETPMRLAERAVALDPNIAKYHRQVAEVVGLVAQHANVFQQIGLARKFHKEIDAALALDPRDIQANRDLIEFHLLAPGIAGGDVHKAEAMAARIAAIDAAQGFLARARIAEFRKQAGAVESLLRQAADAAPAHYLARVALARYYANPDHTNPAAAEEQARRAIQIDCTRVDAYAVLAEVYAQQAEWTKLDALLTEAAAQVPDDLVPYYRAAERLMLTHQNPQRADRYRRVYQSQPPEGNEPNGF